jgi:hypothetical protein
MFCQTMEFHHPQRRFVYLRVGVPSYRGERRQARRPQSQDDVGALSWGFAPDPRIYRIRASRSTFGSNAPDGGRRTGFTHAK